MTRVTLLIAAASLALVAYAGAASQPPALDPGKLPALPAQGLIVQRTHDMLLAAIDGTVIGSLPGFTGPYSGKTPLLEALADADPAAILLAGPDRRPYRLDPAGSRLRPLAQARVPLAGGAFLVAHAIPQPAPYLPKIVLHAVRAGKDLVPPGQFLRVVAGRLVVSGGTVLDTVTGKTWKIGKTDAALSGGCQPAGLSGADLVAVCSTGKPSGAGLRVAVYDVGHDGSRTQTGPTMRWGFGARSALLSPDARFVGATLEVGCDAPVGAITPTGSGRAGYIANGKPVGSKSSVNSYALGWSGDGKLLADIIFTPTDCEHSPPTGVYSVDPATFARKLVLAVPANDAVWLWQSPLG